VRPRGVELHLRFSASPLGLGFFSRRQHRAHVTEQGIGEPKRLFGTAVLAGDLGQAEQRARVVVNHFIKAPTCVSALSAAPLRAKGIYI